MAITPPWALHVDGSNIGFPGTLTVDNTSLTVTALDGPVVALTGNSTNATFIGIYSINGGCAAALRGRVTGINIPYKGTLTNSAQGTLNVAGGIAQTAAPALRVALTSPELSFSTRPAIQA